MAQPAKNLLEGIRVLDFSQNLAGPTVTRMMVEMGAEIIKVELGPNGDQSRQLPYIRNGRSTYYIQQNRGKKSVCINGKNPRAIEIIRKLIPQVDVMVESFAPGAISRLGFGWETVSQLNPRLIMASISAFGQTGPLSTMPGYDYIGSAYGAVMGMTGEADGPPYFPNVGLGDVSTGVHALASINAALFRRERNERQGLEAKGTHIDVSLLDSYFGYHEINVAIHTATNGEVKPHRAGLHHFAVSPIGVFKCKIGYVLIIVLPNNWARFCEALLRPELATDPRFADNTARMKNRDALNAIIEERLTAFPDATAAAAEFSGKFHVPVAPILSVEEAVKHPHMIERETVRTVTDPVFGTFQVPGMPLRFSGYPRHPDLRAAYLGEHNVDVLTRYAGLSEGEVRQLERDGTLVAKPDLDRAVAA
jgi:crotonobetainyl-CoA:carnitine CoA-transferase CaiB-like acyl-CoA transferase